MIVKVWRVGYMFPARMTLVKVYKGRRTALLRDPGTGRALLYSTSQLVVPTWT